MTEMSVLDFGRIYDYRFRGVNLEKKELVWASISQWIESEMGYPDKVLDPAAGRMEFVRNIRAQECWAVDLQSPTVPLQDSRIKFLCGDVFEVDLPHNYFDGVFISNFLEHLYSPEQIAALLKRMFMSLKSGGKIVILGPNFKYCGTEYFDCADHRLALSHVSVEEHLYASGFSILRSIPKFLPYSFRSRLPHSPLLVSMYLRASVLWKFFGKQFLVIAQKP